MKAKNRWMKAIIVTSCLVFLTLSISTPSNAYTAPSKEIEQSTTKSKQDDIEVSKEVQQVTTQISKSMQLIIDEYLHPGVTAQQLFDGAMGGMLNVLDDPYSTYLDKQEYKMLMEQLNAESYIWGLSYITSNLGDYIVNDVFKGSPAEKAGVLVGDVIKKINDINATDITDLSSLLLQDKEIKFVFSRNGKEYTRSLSKAKVRIPTVKYYTLKGNKFAPKKADLKHSGYIKINSISSGTDNEFKEALESFSKEGINKVILDLRDNIGGFLSILEKLGNLIVPKGALAYQVDKNGKEVIVASTLEKLPFEKMVVLVNSETASSAEFLAAALQDSKLATIVGQTSYGKGVVQTVYDIPDNTGFKFTTSELLRRNKAKINNVGVIPDVVVTQPSYITDGIVYHNDGTVLQMDKVKQILRFLDYKTGKINLISDKTTVTSLKKFQKNFGLTPTGIVDNETAEQLNNALYFSLMENDPTLTAGIKVLISR